MKRATCCFVMLTAGLSAQSTTQLEADLMTVASRSPSIRNALAQQIANDIYLMADKDARPSRLTVTDFANELIKALVQVPEGETLTVEKLKPVTEAIFDVLQSSGVTSNRFHVSLDKFQKSLSLLTASPAQAKTAAGRLLILGQEVRGPEDGPLGLRLI